MKNLSRLIEGMHVKAIYGDCDINVSHLTQDSRKVRPETLYFCVKGAKFDGHNFAKDAVINGALALVVEHKLDVDVTQIVVEDSRRAMSLLADKFYDFPSSKLKVIGVTGTSGKTSTTFMIRHLLEQSGYKCGLIGTLAAQVGNEVYSTNMTTPESLDLHRLLHKMVEGGCEYVVMEVSSHSLMMERVEHVRFYAGVFTNLTHDHLDFHNTVEEYRRAKAQLFTKNLAVAVINLDDSSGEHMARHVNAPVTYYSCKKVCSQTVSALNLKMDSRGTTFELCLHQNKTPVTMKTAGKFNVYNALAAISVCLACGISIDEIVRGLSSFIGVPGRFELVQEGQDFLVIVDYAHKPDAIENVLNTINDFKQGRCIVVFGCGGDRDKSKRPIMGDIVGKLSDFAIVTSDNPRSEDSEAIIADILDGLAKVTSDYLVCPDREVAIREAIRMSRRDDVILIAGKGHETYQLIGDRIIHFDDREVARQVIKEVLLDASLEA